MESPFDIIKRTAKGITNTGKNAVLDIIAGPKKSQEKFDASAAGMKFNASPVGVAINTVTGLPREAIKAGKDILQGVARTAIGLGGDIRNATVAPQKRVFEVAPKGFVAKALGPEPIKTIASRVAGNELAIKSSPVAKKLGVSGKLALPIAFAGTVGSATLDLFPGGATEKNALKALAKSTDEKYIANVLKMLKVDEAIIPKISGRIARNSDQKVIANILKEAKVKPAYAEAAIKTSDVDYADAISKELSQYQNPTLKIRKEGVASNVTEVSDKVTRIEELQKINNERALTSKELKEAQALLKSEGIDPFVKPSARQIANSNRKASILERTVMKPATVDGEIMSTAKKIVQDGKKAVIEQPRDRAGKFSYKENPIANASATATKTSNRMVPNIPEIIPKKKGLIQSIKDIPNRQGGFAGVPNPFFGGKKVDQVDELIAQGKIKINRVGNKDVYSYKKGNAWQTARDEDSAVKGAIGKITRTNLPEDLANRKTALEIKKEAIANDPLNALTKYVSKRGDFKGQLPEVLGGKGGAFKKKGDDIITEVMGQNVDSEMVRSQMDDFLKRKNEVALAEKELNAEIKARKSTTANKATEQSAKLLSEQKTNAVSPIQAISKGTGEVRLLERMAEQSATKEIHDPQLRKSSSLPKIIEKTPTPVKAKVNMLDYIRTPENVLKKIGLEKEGELVRKGYDEYLKELPTNIDKITEWSKAVPKESNVRIFQYLDGKNIDLTPAEEKVAGEIKSWLKEWADRLDLPEDNRIAEYITHIFDDQLLAKEFDEDLAKIIADKVPGSVYDPFLQARLGAKGYIQDTWKALDAYVKRATRKVHMDPALAKLEEASGHLEESQWNYVKRYADRINMRPTELDNLVDNGIKQVIGYKLGQRPVTTITRGLRQATFRGMLGLNAGSALRNLSQGINTYAKLGEKYTALGYSKLFSRANMAELKSENVLSSLIQDRTISAVKQTMQKADKVLFSFFETAERINRGAAYFGAKTKGLANGMTERQAIDYAKKIVRETQFQFGSIDTPVGMSSDIVKTLTQFQTFTTKQIEFLAGMAKNKEYAGLIRYALSGLAFVYTIGQAFGMEPKDIIPMYRVGTPPSLKLPTELVKKAAGGESDIASSLPGYVPAGVQAKKTIQGYNAIKEGGSYDAAGKLQFAQGQTPAQKVQALLFGKYASKNAQQYFDKNEISKDEKKRVQPVYDEVQRLISAGNEDEALSVVDSLSDEDYAIYKKIKASVKAEKTIEGKKNILPVYNRVQSLIKAGNEEEARSAVESLTDEEYGYYKLVKNDQEKANKTPSKPEYDQNIVSRYAEAVVKDPANALRALFTKEKLGKVEGNLVELQRFYGLKFNEAGGSEEYKKKRMQEMNIPLSEIENYKLEHIVPVSAGGSSADSNLVPINNAEHDYYTPFDIAIGNAVKLGKITRQEAERLARGLKVTKTIDAEEIMSSLK